MSQIPELLSQVFWNNSLTRVRDRSRNKATGTITLWLCPCSDDSCPHTKQPAPLEEVTPVPSVGTIVCHYCQRIPHTVVSAQVHDGRCLLQLQPDQGEPFWAPLTAIDYCPSVGDQVAVAAGPYCDWIAEQAAGAKGKRKSPSREYRNLMESMNDLSWTCTIFALRLIGPSGLAVIVGDGQRREIPIGCLRVYQKAVEFAQRQEAA